MAVSNNRKPLCSDAIMMTIQISCTEMIYHFSGVPSPSIPHTEQGCWGRSSADLLWKLSPHLGRVDSDGLAPAQRRPALWVSSLLQEKQGADALKCGGFQSLSDSSSRWVMTCEIHRAKMTQSCCVSTSSVCQWLYVLAFFVTWLQFVVPFLYSKALELH